MPKNQEVKQVSELKPQPRTRSEPIEHISPVPGAWILGRSIDKMTDTPITIPLLHMSARGKNHRDNLLRRTEIVA